MRPAAFVAAALAGCAAAPTAEDLMHAPQPAPARHERRYEGVSPDIVAPAVVATLQDLAFQLRVSDPDIGLIVGTRGYRKTPGEIARELSTAFLETLQNAATLQWHRRLSIERTAGIPGFNAAVSIAPAGADSVVRLTLHRYYTRPTGEDITTWAEEIREAELHARFFAALAESLARSGAQRPGK
jgi:hypothetical protein